MTADELKAKLAPLDEDAREHFENLAAKLQFEAGMSREVAELLALRAVSAKHPHQEVVPIEQSPRRDEAPRVSRATTGERLAGLG